MWRRSLKLRSSLIFDYHDQPPCGGPNCLYSQSNSFGHKPVFIGVARTKKKSRSLPHFFTVFSQPWSDTNLLVRPKDIWSRVLLWPHGPQTWGHWNKLWFTTEIIDQWRQRCLNTVEMLPYHHRTGQGLNYALLNIRIGDRVRSCQSLMPSFSVFDFMAKRETSPWCTWNERLTIRNLAPDTTKVRPAVHWKKTPPESR